MLPHRLLMAVGDSVETLIFLALEIRVNITEPYGSVFKEST